MATATDEEINDVREVAGENDFDFVSDLIDGLNDAQWERALTLVDAWHVILPGDLMALEGGRDGLKLSDQEGLDDIRKRMRLLLGLTLVKPLTKAFTKLENTESRKSFT